MCRSAATGTSMFTWVLPTKSPRRLFRITPASVGCGGSKERRLHVIYSANGYWMDEYLLGSITYDGVGSLLDASSWQKSSGHVFQQAGDIVDTGHASFTTSPQFASARETSLSFLFRMGLLFGFFLLNNLFQ
jgi:hypothetical protein